MSQVISTTCEADPKLVKIIHQEVVFSKSRVEYRLDAMLTRFGGLRVYVGTPGLPASKEFDNILVARYWAQNQA